jgi:hypothetical protein
MRCSCLVAVVLILTLLPGCSPEPSDTSPPSQEAPTPTKPSSVTPKKPALPKTTTAPETAHQSETNNQPETTPAPDTTATPAIAPMHRGVVDHEIQVDVYEADKVYQGTTLLTDRHNSEKMRIIEVNMLGEIVWGYLVPPGIVAASDVEWLPNNNILFVSDRRGIFEVNRQGKIVWSYETDKISHDADRLPNGNTIFVWGYPDGVDDAQVTEINPEGEIVWSWHARDYFYEDPYKDIDDAGWTHTNAVTRLSNGNTLICLRNFQFVVEVAPDGSVVNVIGEGPLWAPHDPEILANGNLLVASFRPERVVEIDSETDDVIWEFMTEENGILCNRDADRLPNGNTLVCGVQKVAEITPEGEIVWQLTLNATLEEGTERGTGFYKAERITVQD